MNRQRTRLPGKLYTIKKRGDKIPTVLTTLDDVAFGTKEGILNGSQEENKRTRHPAEYGMSDMSKIESAESVVEDVFQSGINSPLQYRGVIRTLEADRLPVRMLRFLMNRLESYRQKRKMGWSRPQNKYGLNVFASFYLFKDEDRVMLDEVAKTLLNQIGQLTTHLPFVKELLSDPALMGFVFCHDLCDQEKAFEGFTVSLGRKSKISSRFRDRLDIIFECPIVDGMSQGLSRVRVYVDPYREPISSNPSEFFEFEGSSVDALESIYQSIIGKINSWGQPSLYAQREWNHWTSQYIDYFGPRSNRVENSMFANNLYEVCDLEKVLPGQTKKAAASS